MNTQPLSWTFPEYTVPARKKGWYFTATLIFLVIFAYAILTANFLFGLIAVIIAIIIFLFQQKKPLAVQFSLHPKGVSLNNKDYSFKEFKKFWLLYEPPAVKNLYLDFKSALKPTLVIPLQNQNPVNIRQFLKQHLEEDLEKENEPLTETLARVLKI